MFVVRLLVLIFMAAYSYAMADDPGPLNDFGTLVAYSVVVFVPALYLLPTYEAWQQDHDNLTGITLVNVFLGWTFIGWVAAMVWAFKRPAPVVVEQRAHDHQPSAKPTIACPFCAEDILAAARKCKHCGSEIPRTA